MKSGGSVESVSGRQQNGFRLVIPASSDSGGVLPPSNRSHATTDDELAERLAAMGLVTAAVAHEFNNLLHVIQAYISFSVDALPQSSSVAADLQTAMRAVKRAHDLTDQLLRFGRRSPTAKSPQSLHRVISEFVDLWGPVLGPRVEWQVRLEAAIDTVELDVASFERALLNLCVNARDAMPDGGRLEIGTANPEAVDSQPRWVELSIADSGFGMDEETAARIFEPFFTTKPPGKGTGLGLPTVYGILADHGGHIEVHSAPGAGTAFHILLPLSAAGVESPQDSATPIPPTVSADLDGNGRLVLVAEDDPAVREALQRMLRSRGFASVAAATGLEAWELLQRRRGTFSLAMLDNVMPGLSGHDIVARMRAAGDTTPVVLCTGYDPQLPSDDHLGDGGTVVSLPKPFSVDDLMRVLAEVFSD